MNEGICKVCGKVYGKNRSNQKVCPDCKTRIRQEYSMWLNAPRRVRLVRCIVCGKPIEQSLRFHTCSDTCATTLNTITSDIRKQRYKKLRKQGGRVKPPKPMSKLGQRIAEARALGMEYGEYMVMKYMKGENE